MRLMQMAERFKMPIITFIDTPGAYPGVGAEERGQSEAIARNLREMSRLGVPVVCTVIGEGGSGGALAIGVGDKVNMLQYSASSLSRRKVVRPFCGRAPTKRRWRLKQWVWDSLRV